MKRFAWMAALIFATLAAVLGLWALRSIVLLFLAALALSAMTRTPVEFLVRHRVPQGLATLIISLASLALVVGFLLVTGYVLAERLPLAVADFGAAYAITRQDLATSSPMQRAIAQALPSLERLDQLLVDDQTTNIMTLLVGVTSNMATIIIRSVLVIFLSLYWSVDRQWFTRLWLQRLSPEQRTHARTIGHAIETGVGAYIRSEVIQCVLAGLLLALGFWLMGVKYPVLLAWVGMLLWLLPRVGAFLAILPTLLVGWLSGPLIAILAALYLLAVVALMEIFIWRHLGRRDQPNAILGLLIAIALLDLLGIWGLLLAPPLTVVVQTFLKEWLTPTPQLSSSLATAELDLASLHQQVAAVSEAMSGLAGPLPPQTASLYERLVQLVSAVEQSDSTRQTTQVKLL
jgi:predicted PurR-regulated permease PerM